MHYGRSYQKKKVFFTPQVDRIEMPTKSRSIPVVSRGHDLHCHHNSSIALLVNTLKIKMTPDKSQFRE